MRKQKQNKKQREFAETECPKCLRVFEVGGNTYCFCFTCQTQFCENCFEWKEIAVHKGTYLRSNQYCAQCRNNENRNVGRKKRFFVLYRDNFTCRYCGAKAPDVKFHVDHKIPVSKGGNSELSNLVTACVDCNYGKSNQLFHNL